MTDIRLFPLRLLPLGVLAACLIAPARADVRYTTQMAFGGDTARGGAPAMRTTTYVRNNDERVETSMQIGPMQSNTVTLNLCGKKQTIRMDPALKIYTVAPMGATAFVPSAPNMPGVRGMGAGRSGSPSGKAGEGKVITTVSAQDLGQEKLLNLDTHHVMLTVRTQSSGCAGDSDNTVKMEVWTAPIKTVDCPDRFTGTSSPTPDANGEEDCKTTYEMKGDVDKMRDLFSGMIVQQKLYQGDKVVMTQTLREHSLAELDPALFTVPADYKQVSETEFAKAQQDAMMKAMMRGMPSGQGATQAEPAEKTDAAEAPSGDKAEPPAEEKKDEQPKKKFRLPKLPF